VTTCAVLIGAMKAGTTTLFSAIARHPLVLPSIEKEPGIFLDPKNLMDLDAYWPRRPDATEVRFEASTHYTKMPFNLDVPKIMGDSGLDLRLLYSVRHPLDRAISQTRFMNHHFPFKPWTILSDRIVYWSRYHYQLQFYRRELPDLPILLIDFRRIEEQSLYDEIFAFLSLPSVEVPALHLHRSDELGGTGLRSRLRSIAARVKGERRRPRYVPTPHEVEWFYRQVEEDMDRFEDAYGIAFDRERGRS